MTRILYVSSEGRCRSPEAKNSYVQLSRRVVLWGSLRADSPGGLLLLGDYPMKDFLKQLLILLFVLLVALYVVLVA